MLTQQLAVERAQYIATAAHEGQKDKIGEDYIHHPAAVVSLLTQSPGYQHLSAKEQTQAVAAAWLHDVLEDTTLKPTDLLHEGFDAETVAIVEALTHLPGEPRSDYYNRVAAEPIARLVKIADIAHNASEDRLRWLDSATRERLRQKYSGASQRLIFHDDERFWFDETISPTTGSSR